MPTIHVVDRQGVRHTISADDDVPLMFSLRDAGFALEGTCGGTASCGTCHVYVSDAFVERLGARNESELEMLDALANFDERRSRLSCQINATAEIDGLEITLAPEEFV
jgi:2Fe-2S ferredoxin